MNSESDSKEKSAPLALRPTAANGSASKPLERISLIIRGLGPVRSFKNRKRVAGLRRDPQRPNVWHGCPTLITRPDVKEWMRQAVKSIASQLSSAFPTGAAGITPECSKRSAMSWLPPDDCWEDLEIGSVTTVLVEPGEEGADITIELIP